MISYLVSRLVIQVFGTLYPAYSSYKTVRSKNAKGYVQWMKYWIVFAFLSCVEPFCDFFFSSWAPFYYESKILLVAWLLCPATRGYNYLYRAVLHPTLLDNEEYIDAWLTYAKDQWREAVLQLGKRGSAIMMQTMLKGVLSRTAIGSCFQRSDSFADQTFAYRDRDEHAYSYYRQQALIRTLFLAETRRNSDPNSFPQLHGSYNEKPSDLRCVPLRNRGLTSLRSVHFVDDDRPILSKSVSVDSGDKMKRSCRDSGEKLSLSLETLGEFDERIQNLPPAVNHRLACLARKLSLEGLTDEHIGTVVSTLISDLDPNLSVSSDEAETSTKDDSEISLTETSAKDDSEISLSETSGPGNLSQNEECQPGEGAENKHESKSEENFQKSASLNDSKHSRAGRYRKLPAPSPPDSKKVTDHNE